MRTCKWQKKVERWFDGETATHDGVGQHVAACPECSALVDRLRALREAAKASVARPIIDDPQFPAFMEGIRDRIQEPARHHRGLWALASVTAASMIVAASVLFILVGGPADVAATEVESATTDIENATVEFYSSEDGSATVWVSEGGGEMW
jgi:anti-sigma factor RsiW